MRNRSASDDKDSMRSHAIDKLFTFKEIFLERCSVSEASNVTGLAITICIQAVLVQAQSFILKPYSSGLGP